MHTLSIVCLANTVFNKMLNMVWGGKPVNDDKRNFRVQSITTLMNHDATSYIYEINASQLCYSFISTINLI